MGLRNGTTAFDLGEKEPTTAVAGFTVDCRPANLDGFPFIVQPTLKCPWISAMLLNRAAPTPSY